MTRSRPVGEKAGTARRPRTVALHAVLTIVTLTIGVYALKALTLIL